MEAKTVREALLKLEEEFKDFRGRAIDERGELKPVNPKELREVIENAKGELYEKGFRSIGCSPCTRPVAPYEDPRVGRWWWEVGAPKECGMHCRLKTGRPLKRG